MPVPPRERDPVEARLDDDGPPVRITGMADLVVAVPYLLGFHPEDSLVVVATRTTVPHVCLTMRFDLPPDRIGVAGSIIDFSGVVRALRNAQAQRVFLLVYRAVRMDEDRPVLPCQALLGRVLDGVHAAGFEIGEALCVASGEAGQLRYWSYLCLDRGCCPPQGRVIEADRATRIGFGFVSHGRGVLPTRAALVDSLSPVADQGTTELLAAAQELRRSTAKGPGPDSVGGQAQAAWRRRRIRLARRADRALATATSQVPPKQVPVRDQAVLLRALSDVSVRDLVLAEAARRDQLEAVVAVLTPLVRRAPAGLVAPVAASLALCAYLLGDGALSWVALDRARADDPDHSLTTVLSGVLDAGIGPDGMWQVVRSLPRIRGWDGRPVRVGRGAGPRG